MKNQKRFFAVLALAWALLVGAGVLVYALGFAQQPEFLRDSDALSIGTRTYISTNGTDGGVLYALDEKGKSERIFACSGTRYVNGWKLVALAAKDEDGAERGDFYAVFSKVRDIDDQMLFRVGQFSDKLRLIALTPPYLTGSGYEVSGFSFSEDACDITAIHGNGKEISVYELSEKALMNLASATNNDRGTLEGDAAGLAPVQRVHAEGTDSYADAEYVQGEFYTRMENEELGNYFAEDLAAKELFDNRSTGVLLRVKEAGISRITVALVFGIGLVVLAFLVFLLPMRRRVFYHILVAESAITIAVLFLVGGASHYLMKSEQRNLFDAEAFLLSLSGTYGDWSTEEGRGKGLQMIAQNSAQADAHVVDVCLVDISTGEILADLEALERHTFDYVYGQSAAEAVRTSEEGVLLSGADAGRRRFAVSGEETGAGGSRLLAVLELPDYGTYLREDRSRVLLAGILLFFILSALEILLAMAENRDIAELSAALSGLVEEGFEYKKPSFVVGKDICRMWSSIHEIEKYIGRESRIRFLTYQAYFRFAPKSIEKILKKDSITEVRSGDAIRMVGTIAFLSTEPQQGDDRMQLNRRNAFMQLVDKLREAHDGIHVQGDANLSTMRVLFPDESRSSVRFGTELLSELGAQEEELRMPQASVLLHYAPFVYGVVGNETQASAFLSAPEAEQLLTYAEWFRRMGLGVVLTEAVQRRESKLYSLRHIGFVRIGAGGEDGEGKKVELYEALDAEEFSVRQGKLRHLMDFEEALNLFYARDFYFARSAFTDILRDVPQDAVARWYLFECERLLNEEADEGFAGELHL